MELRRSWLAVPAPGALCTPSHSDEPLAHVHEPLSWPLIPLTSPALAKIPRIFSEHWELLHLQKGNYRWQEGPLQKHASSSREGSACRLFSFLRVNWPIRPQWAGDGGCKSVPALGQWTLLPPGLVSLRTWGLARDTHCELKVGWTLMNMNAMKHILDIRHFYFQLFHWKKSYVC